MSVYLTAAGAKPTASAVSRLDETLIRDRFPRGKPYRWVPPRRQSGRQ
jgi:hypothetical protein